ncbi:MAG: rRNA maturation RNase YbeY [Desulfobacteraceae bacterium]|nr:rRNA maturation RNase YbeY [Desulfobacteraceae bacterium]
MPTVQKRAQAILNALGSPEAELSVLLVDDPRIAELNEAYLQHTGPTNVISFPMQEGDHGDINPGLLGDIVISMDTCAREAEMGGISAEARFYELLIHGVLHLFGYDHIHSEEEEREMEAKSRELLALVEAED